MFCQNCGSMLEEGVKFCPNCGASIAQPEPVRETAVNEPVQPTFETPVYEQPVVKSNPAADALSTPILIFGILGIAFASSFYLSILGIIFSGIAKSKVRQFLAEGGVLSGKAKVGSILARIGMILGIVLTVLFVIWLIAVIVAAIAGSNSYSSYSYNW